MLQPISFHLTAFHGDFPELQLRMEPASLLQGGLKCCCSLLLSFELGSTKGRCVFSFQKTFLFCCSHIFSLQPLFHDHTPFSLLPALTFICLPSSAVHFLIPLLSVHLAISCSHSSSASTGSSHSTDLSALSSPFHLSSVLDFSSLFHQVQSVAYKAVALSLTSFSISISILQASLGITCIMFCFFQL